MSNSVDKTRSDNIRMQVLSEGMHRDDMELLQKFEEWLLAEEVDEGLREKMIVWVTSLIDELLHSRIQTKQRLAANLSQALLINHLRFS